MDNMPKLMPIWHDLSSQYFINLNKKNAKYSRLKLPDHGGIGMDVNYDGNVLTTEVAKHPKSQINFAAKCCALPFLPLCKVPNIADPCIEPLKKENMDFYKFCLKLKFVKNAAKRKTFSSDLKTLQKEFKKMCAKGKYGNRSIKVPKSIAELAEHRPKRKAVPIFNVAYAGGNLAVCKYSSKQSLLHPSCEVINKLCITPMQDLSDGHFEPILSDQDSVDFKDGPILQIESVLNGFCCIRQKDCFHLLNLDNLKFTSETTNNTLLYHIAACPYNPMEILSVYEKGILELKNMETGKIVWNDQDFSCSDRTLIYPTWRCGFGSHPFSVLCMNENYLSSFDYRTENDMKMLFSVQNPSCHASEELVSVKQWSRNPFQHILVSSHHLMICDERYPKRPVLFSNHTFQDYPVYCEVANLENSTNSVVVIGTQETRESCAFFIDSPQTQIQPVSLGPFLALSSPSDCIDSLKLHCYSVNEAFSSRLSYPMSGICVVPHSQNRTFTVFQSTSVADIFYQNFKEVYSEVSEKTYRIGAGCVLTPPEKILPHVKDWISKNDPVKEVSKPTEESFSRLLINVDKILKLPKEISASCNLCRLNNASGVKELVVSEVCPMCNLSSAESHHFSNAMTMLTAVIGPDSEEPNFLECDIDYLSQFTDKYSKNILSVWLEPGDINEMSQLSTTETHLDSVGVHQSLNLSILSQESNISFIQNENTSMDAIPSVTVEASYSDFNEDTETNSEMIPPSQEVRPVIGEVLRTPAKSILNRSKIKILSSAGF